MSLQSDTHKTVSCRSFVAVSFRFRSRFWRRHEKVAFVRETETTMVSEPRVGQDAAGWTIRTRQKQRGLHGARARRQWSSQRVMRVCLTGARSVNSVLMQDAEAKDLILRTTWCVARGVAASDFFGSSLRRGSTLRLRLFAPRCGHQEYRPSN